jgi:hypothetical protein
MALQKDKCTCCRLATLNFILVICCFCYFAFSADMRTHINPAALRLLGFCEPVMCDISNGEINVDQAFHIIDTENHDASDYLDTINGGNAGHIVILEAAHDDRTVVVRSGFGNIFLQGNFSLNSKKDKIMLIKSSDGIWHQVSIANNDN